MIWMKRNIKGSKSCKLGSDVVTVDHMKDWFETRTGGREVTKLLNTHRRC